jgi:hypothetical protein
MEDFKSILYPCRTHRNFTQGSPLCGDHGQTAGCTGPPAACAAALRLVRGYLCFRSPGSLTSSALPVTSKVRSWPRRNKSSKRFKQVFQGHPYCQHDVVSGTHYKQILSYVESEGIDLIIMGTGTTGAKSDVRFGCGKSLQAGHCPRDVGQKRLKRMV